MVWKLILNAIDDSSTLKTFPDDTKTTVILLLTAS